MLLTLTTTHAPATDLGYLLHKNPERPQSFELPFGRVHVFYPEASAERTTAALVLDVDPVGLVRNRRGPSGEAGALGQYVNDRPWVASSFLSVALARVYRSAISGACKDRPELAEARIPLVAKLSVVPCRGGEALLRRLFEPLGYRVTAERHPLDETVPQWGDSRFFTLTLQAEARLQDVLAHLYVLVPVLDDDKHYWVGDGEVEKLLRHGEGWLGSHPERELIARRYLRHQKSLAREALERLAADEGPGLLSSPEAQSDVEESALEAKVSLNELRLDAVVKALEESGASRVLDVGCGEGKLLRALLKKRQFTEVVGMDVSVRSLEIASERLRLEQMSDAQRKRVTLLHGSLMYRDARLTGFDAAAVVEVIEHLDPPRVAAFERVLFEFARPQAVVLTTPNAEFNVRFESLPAGTFRHRDHRFEWTRAEFVSWANGICVRFGYSVTFAPVGPVDDEVGAPTQMAVFTR